MALLEASDGKIGTVIDRFYVVLLPLRSENAPLLDGRQSGHGGGLHRNGFCLWRLSGRFLASGKEMKVRSLIFMFNEAFAGTFPFRAPISRRNGILSTISCSG